MWWRGNFRNEIGIPLALLLITIGSMWYIYYH